LNSHPGQYDGTNDSKNGYVEESDNSSPDNSSPLMMQTVQRPPLGSKSGSGTIQRSVSPAPMTGFVTGTSRMYPHSVHNASLFSDAHAPTAIRG